MYVSHSLALEAASTTPCIAVFQAPRGEWHVFGSTKKRVSSLTIIQLVIVTFT